MTHRYSAASLRDTRSGISSPTPRAALLRCTTKPSNPATAPRDLERARVAPAITMAPARFVSPGSPPAAATSPPDPAALPAAISRSEPQPTAAQKSPTPNPQIPGSSSGNTLPHPETDTAPTSTASGSGLRDAFPPLLSVSRSIPTCTTHRLDRRTPKPRPGSAPIPSISLQPQRRARSGYELSSEVCPGVRLLNPHIQRLCRPEWI